MLKIPYADPLMNARKPTTFKQALLMFFTRHH